VSFIVIFGTLSFAVVSRRSCMRLQSAVYDTLKRAKVNVTRADSLSDAVMMIHCELAFIRSFIYYSAPDNRRTGHFRRGGAGSILPEKYGAVPEK